MPMIQPPFCQIIRAEPVVTSAGKRWRVTVGDRSGEVAMVELDEVSLQTYERFQAAVREYTGRMFQYLPVGEGTDSATAGTRAERSELAPLGITPGGLHDHAEPRHAVHEAFHRNLNHVLVDDRERADGGA
jgi:hypothetical protein